MIAAEAGLETVHAVCNASTAALQQIVRDTSRVTCDANQRTEHDRAVSADALYKTFVLDLGGDEQTSKSGTPYKAPSSHNTDVANGHLVIPVKP